MQINTIPDKLPSKFQGKLKKGKYDEVILFTLAVFGPHKYEEFVNNASHSVTNRMEEDSFHEWAYKLKSSGLIEEYQMYDEIYFKATEKGKDKLMTQVENSANVKYLKGVFSSAFGAIEPNAEIESKSISGFTLSYRDFIFGLLSYYWKMYNFYDAVKESKTAGPDKHASIGIELEKNARKFADNPAIFYEDISYTYKEQNEWINRYANYFLSLGVKKGEVINIFLENRPEMIFLIGTMSKIGTIGSLINTRQRSTTLLHSMKIKPVKIYIIGEELIQPFEEIKAKLELTGQEKLYFLKDKGELETPEGYIDLIKEIINQNIENPPTTSNVMGKDTFVYIFTSGTTGLPKAVHIRNFHTRGSLNSWGQMAMHMTPSDVLYLSLPLYHSNPINIAWASTLKGGSAIAIARKFSARSFWKDIIKFKATCFNYVGEICRYLYNQEPSAIECQHNVTKICGNGLRSEIWKEFKERFGIREVYEHYGATEMTNIFCNYFNLDCTIGFNWEPYAIVKYDVKNGIPIRNEKGFFERVEEGQAGLLIVKIRSQYIFAGYTDKEASAKKIFKNPFGNGESWINTGDLLRNIGYFHAQFVDRLGDTFRWKGENVSTSEVEDVISSFKGIKHVSVYGVEISGTEGRAGMSSIITKQNDTEFDFNNFLNMLKRNLPPYAIPKFIRFLSELSTTGTYKIQKSEMKDVGYDIRKINDQIYVLLPGSSEYILLTEKIYNNIIGKSYRF